MLGDLLEGLLVEIDGVGAPVDVLVGPAEADKVWDDDAVAAGGEEGDEAVEGLRPEGLSVQAQDHLEEGKRHGILSQEVQGGSTRLYSGNLSILYAV